MRSDDDRKLLHNLKILLTDARDAIALFEPSEREEEKAKNIAAHRVRMALASIEQAIEK